MIRWRVVVPVVAGALLVGLYASDYATARRNGNGPDIGPVTAVRSGSQITLPLDAYTELRAAWRVRQTAIGLLGGDCMRRLGLDWTVPQRDAPDTEASEHSRRYGLVDTDHARRSGYHQDPAEVAYTARVKEISRNVSDPAYRAWVGEVRDLGGVGVPVGGCRGEATARIGGELPQDLGRLVERLAGEARGRAWADHRVQRAVEEWRRCMAAAGYRYSSQLAAAGDPRWADGSPRPSAVEVLVATTDVDCNQQANLAGVWLAVESAHQIRLIGRHEAQLAEIKQWLDKVAAEATRVVGGR